MSEAVSILEALAAGGDLALFVLIYFIWRLERRVYRIELLHSASQPAQSES